MEDTVELSGDKVRISNHLHRKYAREVARIANDPEIARNIGAHTFPNPYTEEDALIFFEHNRKDGKKHFAMDFLIFSGDQLVGIIGLKDINYTDLNAHVGYWIGKEYWNHGFASDALALVSKYCRSELGMIRLYTSVLDYNLPSLRVLMKNGFKVEGYKEKCFRMDDGFHSMFSVSKLL